MTTTELRPMTRIVKLADQVERGLAAEDVMTIGGGTWWGKERAALTEIIRIATEADARGGKRERAKNARRKRGRQSDD